MKTNSDGEPIIPFGKHNGKSIKDLPTKYLDWIIGQDWFCEKFKDLKDEVIKELKSRPEWDNQSMSGDD